MLIFEPRTINRSWTRSLMNFPSFLHGVVVDGASNPGGWCSINSFLSLLLSGSYLSCLSWMIVYRYWSWHWQYVNLMKWIVYATIKAPCVTHDIIIPTPTCSYETNWSKSLSTFEIKRQPHFAPPPPPKLQFLPRLVPMTDFYSLYINQAHFHGLGGMCVCVGGGGSIFSQLERG